MRSFLVNAGLLFVLFAILSALAFVKAEISFLLGLALILLAGFALFRPLPTLRLGSRITSSCVVLIGLISATLSAQSLEQCQSQERLALRAKDPLTYLSDVRARLGDVAYLQELKLLDPAAYAAEILRQEAAAAATAVAQQALKEQERQAEITRLKERRITLGTLPLADQAQLLARLVELEPAQPEHAKALEKVRAAQAEIIAKDEAQRRRQDIETKARRQPETFLDLVDFTWTKTGFGVVMEARFKVKNRSPFDIKDIRFDCAHFAPSGTQVDSSSRIVYDRVKSGQTRNFSNVNMGLIHNQVASSRCSIVAAKTL